MLVYHLTNLYITQRHGVEAFVLRDGGVYTMMFWIGQVLIGYAVPLVIAFSALGKSRSLVALAAVCVILGGLAQMYVTIIGGQAYPMPLLPGKDVVASGFFDGVVASYSPTLPEVLLGIGGFAIALILVAFAVKVLPFLPQSLADADVDPHQKAGAV
jgi:molybdopterin-containing oxidoreductase family membrane subunit